MALSHVILHVTLCNAAIRQRAQTVMPMRVNVVDRVKRDIVDQEFRIVRESVNVATVSFDMPWGVYRANIDMKAGRAGCAASQFFAVVIDHNRTLNVTLQDAPVPLPVVPSLIFGAAPFAFAYVQPTVQIFDHSVKCNGPVGDPINADVVTQNDSDGYYATILPTRDLLPHMPLVIALRLTDSRGNYHYVRIPTDFVAFGASWPNTGTLNADENVIDYVADKTEDTLLCPKMYKTITR